METIKIKKNSFKKALSKAKEVLLRNYAIIIPTETVYGIVALASSEEAIKKVYEIKNRPFVKPLPLIASRMEGFEGWSVFNEEAKKLADKFWPGPLTMILPKGEKASLLITSGGNNIAVRIPDHYFMVALIDEVGEPLVATSANLSGEEEPARLEDVSLRVRAKIALGIDAGRSTFEKPSTVIDLTKEQKPILRPGPITGREIMEVLKEGGRK